MKKSKPESSGAAALARSSATKAAAALARMEAQLMNSSDCKHLAAGMAELFERHAAQLAEEIVAVKTTAPALAHDAISRLTVARMEAMSADAGEKANVRKG